MSQRSVDKTTCNEKKAVGTYETMSGNTHSPNPLPAP